MANRGGYYSITTRFQIQVNGNTTNNSSTIEETHDHEVEIIQPFKEAVNIVEVPLQFSTNMFLVLLSGFLLVYAVDPPKEIDTLCLPAQQLHDRSNLIRTYIERVLYSLNVTRTASNAIAAYVVSFLLRQNTHVNFNIYVVVDNIRGYTVMPLPPTMESRPLKAMAMLKKNEEEGDFKVCSICMDQICPNMEVEIWCGHVYHESCIITWLNESNFCPLCRSSRLL